MSFIKTKLEYHKLRTEKRKKGLYCTMDESLCFLWCITSFPSHNLTLSNFNETSSSQRQINPFMDENIPTLTSELYVWLDVFLITPITAQHARLCEQKVLFNNWTFLMLSVAFFNLFLQLIHNIQNELQAKFRI